MNQVDLTGKKTKWQPQGNKVKTQETQNPLCFKASNANICGLSVINDSIQLAYILLNFSSPNICTELEMLCHLYFK